MKLSSRLTAVALTTGALLVSVGAAFAGLGHPTPWQLGLQDAASPVMADIISFHNFVLWIITAIMAFVLILLVIIVVRFNARANPTPSRTTHNTLLEVTWTIVPVIILVLIAVPSFGIKIDAVPGRLNETWFKATSEGLFHGQCSELCGKNHAFMPITVRVVSESDFATWVAAAKQKFAATAPTTLAAADPRGTDVLIQDGAHDLRPMMSGR